MSNAYPRSVAPIEPPVLQRGLYGWVCLSILFVLLIVMGLLANGKKTDRTIDSTTLETHLKQAVADEAVHPSSKPDKKDVAETPEQSFKSILDVVSPKRFEDANASAFYGIVCVELKRPLNELDVAALRLGTPNQRRAADILMASHLTTAEAENLTSGIPENNFYRKLLRADAFQKAGKLAPRQRLLSDLRGSQYLVEGLGIGLFAIGLGLWIGFISLRSNGLLIPQGLPNLPMTVFGADRLATKAVLFFFVYTALMIVVEIVGTKGPIYAAIGALLTVATFPSILKLRTGGGPITLESLGMGRGSPWAKLVALGVIGFLMEFPVAMIMGSIGENIFSHQTFTHPAEAELTSSHNLWTVVSLFLLASVQAPLFEEMIFRGLMLPAIARIAGLLPSIVITSSLFAFLHPQGVGAWLGLATIAAASSVLIYHTRSLLPSIVLHACHNAFTLCFVLLMS